MNLEHLGRTDVDGGARVGILNATGFDYSDLPAIVADGGTAYGLQVVEDTAASDPFFARSDN